MTELRQEFERHLIFRRDSPKTNYEKAQILFCENLFFKVTTYFYINISFFYLNADSD